MSDSNSERSENELRDETATSLISPNNSLSHISTNGNNDSGIENGNSSTVATTSDDCDSEVEGEGAPSRSGSNNIVSMRVRGSGRGRAGQTVDVDMTPPNRLLKAATDRAVRLTSRNKNEEAVLEYVKILALTRIVFGDEHWRVPEAYVNLARAYLELRGLAEQARQHCETARGLVADIQKKSPESQLDNLLLVKLNLYLILGRALTKLNKYEEAETALTRADKCARQRNQGSIVDPMAMMRSDNTIATALGRLYLCQKKYSNAVTCFEQAVELTSKVHGEHSDNLIQVYTDLGRAEQQGAVEDPSKHSHEKAIQHFLHAHEIASANHPGSSSETGKTAEVVANGYLNLATSSKKAGSEVSEDALKSCECYFSESADIYLRDKGDHHPDTIRVSEQLSKVYIKLKDFESAKSFAKSVLEGKTEVYGDFSEETASTQQTLGTICLSQGNFEEAYKHLKKAYASLSNLFGSTSKRVKDVEKIIALIEESPQMKDKLTREKELQKRPAFNSIFKPK